MPDQLNDPQFSQRLPQNEVPLNTEGTSAPVPATGSRSAFRDIRRQLSEDDLKQPGVQKIIIEDFERAEAECERLREYEKRYHEKSTEAAILAEKLKSNIALEIVTGATLAVGGAIASFASLFPGDSAKFWASLLIGIVLIVASTTAKLFQRLK